jgi:dTDP-4-dehydrorhamnose reductase
MIWLIGNQGMLGSEVEMLLRKYNLPYIASDKEVDITDPRRLRRFVSDSHISWILNCSAYTAVDKAEDEPEIAFRINADGPRAIAEIAKEKNAKLIHISTDYVFDGTKQAEYLETDAPNPLGIYGRSKYAGEVNIAESCTNYFILRTAWLYGKQGKNFVSTMMQLLRERDLVRVVGDQFGSPTYAHDLAEAMLEIIRLNSEAYGIYHYTNEGRIHWHDFACEIYRLMQENNSLDKEVIIQKIGTQEYPQKAKRPQNSHLSKEKIKSILNIVVRPWKSGLRDFLK